MYVGRDVRPTRPRAALADACRMTLELGLGLAALALVDSLSIGTLLIPLFFLLAPGRVRAARVLLFLGTIAAFYFVVGLMLTAGASTLMDGAAGALETPAARWVQLVIGAGLLVGSFFIGGKKEPQPARAAVDASHETATAAGPGTRENGAPDDASVAGSSRPGRLARWRDRALGDGSPLIVVSLALGAGLLEVATMLPYLGAIGMITAASLPLQTVLVVLAGYCVVMILPALVLLTGRMVARRIVEPPLRRLAGWLERNAAENTAWIVGIVGFLLARDAATQLGLLEFAFGSGSS